MIAFLLFISTALSAECSHGTYSMCSSNSAAVTWDYVLHVQTWAGYFCSTKCCDLPSTTMDVHEGFTMHGWWPNFISGYPSCCKQSDFTDAEVTSMIESDSTLKKDLAYYWPSFTKCHFFQYEYDKHGTCIQDMYAGLTGVKNYANAAMNFMKNHDIWSIFKKNGVTADGSTKYSKSWLKQLVQNEFGVQNCVFFTCSSNYLSEMRICTTVSKANQNEPTVIECPGTVIEDQETCGDNIVFYKLLSLTESGCEY